MAGFFQSGTSGRSDRPLHRDWSPTGRALRAPQIEAVDAPVTDPFTVPEPAGFGRRTGSSSRTPARSATSSGLLAIRMAAIGAVLEVSPILRNAMTPVVCSRPIRARCGYGMRDPDRRSRRRRRGSRTGTSESAATKKRSVASHSG